MGTPGADPQTDPAAGGGLTPGAGSERQTRPGSAVARAASSTRSRCTSDSPASSSQPAALATGTPDHRRDHPGDRPVGGSRQVRSGAATFR
jgi:hypothetical protein